MMSFECWLSHSHRGQTRCCIDVSAVATLL